MTSYTTLVGVDPESTALDLTKYISQLIVSEKEGFLNECAPLIESAKTEELIAKYLAHSRAILNQDNGEDVDGCIQAIVSLLFTLSDDVDTAEVMKSIRSAITSSNESPRNRLRALTSLFNLAMSSQSKYEILTAIFRFAIATGETDRISHFHLHVENWINSWELSLADRRSLYRLVSEIMVGEDKTPLALRYLVKFFGTFSEERFPADVESLAKVSVINAIKSPVSSFSDRNALLESIPAQVDGEFAKLVELLKIICAGSLASYSAFEAANSDLIASQGLNRETIRHSISLLTICSLGAQQSEVSYESIATALSIPVSDVELWVVEAMSHGLVEGSIDQFAQTISISRCAYRSFGQEHWRGLQQKVAAIKGNLAMVLDAVKKHGGGLA